MLSADQVAAALGISRRAVYELARTGLLPCARPTAGGRRVVFEAADVEGYKESCRSRASETVRVAVASSLNSAGSMYLTNQRAAIDTDYRVTGWNQSVMT